MDKILLAFKFKKSDFGNIIQNKLQEALKVLFSVEKLTKLWERAKLNIANIQKKINRFKMIKNMIKIK